MHDSLIRGILSGLAASLILSPAYAHGGQYTGPGDVVPPGGGGGRTPTGPRSGGPKPRGPTTGVPTAPTAPGSPTNPTTGGPPGSPGARNPTTGGAALTEDLTQWDIWWEINKARYLHLKEAIHRDDPVSGGDEIFLGPTRRRESRDLLQPTDKDIQDDVVPALRRALDETDNRDIQSSCMIALAKIGDRPGFRLHEVLIPRLGSHDQETRETAAIALGIAGPGTGGENLAMLHSLARDTADGRQATGGAVDDRVRTFATYGLGVFAAASTDTAHKQQVVDTLLRNLTDPAADSRNLRVATILAIGLVTPDSNDPAGRELQRRAVDGLRTYWLADLGPGTHLVQAHCATSLQRLIPPTDPLAPELRRELTAELQGKLRRQDGHDLTRSAALALGRMALPCNDGDAPEAAVCRTLLAVAREHRDIQTRAFATMALGQVPGTLSRSLLLEQLAQKTTRLPWVALALGVHEFDAHAAARAAGAPPTSDGSVGNALLDQLREARAPELQGALAIALGLCQHLPAVATLRELLAKNAAKEDVAGHICIALALMGNAAAREPIQQLLTTAVRRPSLLSQAAMALGRLGDKSVADRLLAMLKEGDGTLARMSAIARALGHIGDRRSIRPLTGLLFEPSMTALSRAFAAVGLGGVADRRRLPWNSQIGADMNYRAATETLLDRASGVLDIL